MKKTLLILILVLNLTFTAIFCYATDNATVSLIQTETENDDICIDICISAESKACGGNFDISYDSTLLKPEKYEIDNEFPGGIVAVNLDYGSGIVKISWAGINELTSGGVLCKLFFSNSSDKSFSTTIDISRCKLIDINAETLPVNVEKAEITKSITSDTSALRPGASLGTGNNNKSGGNSKYEDIEDAKKFSAEEKSYVGFKDVKDTDWYAGSVRFVVENNLMNGIDEDSFAPGATLTRAMLVTVLYRHAGESEVGEEQSFDDVDKDAYYSNAIIWAKHNGIVNGLSENKFAPDENITREQIAAIIYRYASYIGYDISVTDNTDLLMYSDYEAVSDYAVLPVRYSVARGFVKGKTESSLCPGDNASRAEMAAILHRFIESGK